MKTFRLQLFAFLVLLGTCFAQIPASYFGMHYQVGTTPAVSIGSHRLWDTNTRWQEMNTAASTYSFTTLDALLAHDKSIGVSDVLLTLSGTPHFISSDASNSVCDYASTANGSCGVPTDIATSCTNVDGLHDCDTGVTGTNQTWRSFIYALANHLSTLSGSTYATVSYFEIWNEFTRGAGSWEGTDAQMVRMAQDAKCILLGTGTITATSETCTAGHMGVASVGVMSGAQITTPSNASMGTSSNITKYGTYLGTSGAIGAATIAAVHTYPWASSSTCCSSPELLPGYFSTANGQITGAGGSQPLWTTEGSWGLDGTNLSTSDFDGFVVRYYLLGWAAGFSRMYWYQYDNAGWGTLWYANGSHGCGSSSGCLTSTGTAYQQVYSWMVGATMSVPCTNSGTVWHCDFTRTSPPGYTARVVWDTGGSSSYTPTPSAFIRYRDLAGGFNTLGATVTIGKKPILLEGSGTAVTAQPQTHDVPQ